MRRILPFFALTAALAATPQAQAQGMAFALTRTENLASGGWDTGEVFEGTAIRIEVPRGRVVPFVSVARTRMNNSPCPDCGTDNLPTVFLLGTSFRAFSDAAGRFVPYGGVGAQLSAWDNGDRFVQPHLHAGVDLFVTRLVALRAEGQTNWSVPGYGSLGLRVRVP
jgi:hypothetical protein